MHSAAPYSTKIRAFASSEVIRTRLGVFPGALATRVGFSTTGTGSGRVDSGSLSLGFFVRLISSFRAAECSAVPLHVHELTPRGAFLPDCYQRAQISALSSALMHHLNMDTYESARGANCLRMDSTGNALPRRDARYFADHAAGEGSPSIARASSLCPG
jgi:hypothetical protein